jgi:hypothetical protein
VNANDVLKFGALFIAAGEGREFGEADRLYWQGLIGHLTYEQAIEAAAEHARTSPFPLKPAHVLEWVRRIGNDRVERAFVDPDYRDRRDEARDERLAELVGGDRRILGEPRRGRGEPATDESRAAVLASIRSIGGASRESDAAAVAALGPLNELDSYKVLETFPDWPRNRAAKALVHARCVELGIEPPKPWTAERRRLRPTRVPGSSVTRAASKDSTVQHLDRLGMNALFADSERRTAA